MSAAQSHTALRLSSVSRDSLANRNVLCRQHAPMRVEWLDDDWMFDFIPASIGAPAECFVECDWGGARVFVGVARDALARVAQSAMPGDEPADWPMPVLLAALELGAARLASAIETSTRKSLRVVSVASHPQPDGLDTYGWRAWSGQHDISGELLLDGTASRYLAAALREQPLHPADTDWDDLPLHVRLMAGWVDLSASALRTVAIRDVLVLDECLLSPDNRLIVSLGPRLGLPCALNGSELEVLEGVTEIMADIDDSMAAASGLIDDVPVRLTFDLGEREISLGDLRSLQPGYLFNLGRDPKNTVSIRANGRLIGEGELVDIEGRVGVSVLHFTLASQ